MQNRALFFKEGEDVSSRRDSRKLKLAELMQEDATATSWLDAGTVAAIDKIRGDCDNK